MGWGVGDPLDEGEPLVCRSTLVMVLVWEGRWRGALRWVERPRLQGDADAERVQSCKDGRG